MMSTSFDPMESLERAEDALAAASVSLVAAHRLLEHHGLLDLVVHIEGEPEVRIGRMLDRALEIARPVNVASDVRRGS